MALGACAGEELENFGLTYRAFVLSLNSFANQNPPDPHWNQRHDFNGNGVVNTIDVGRFVFVLKGSCALSGP